MRSDTRFPAVRGELILWDSSNPPRFSWLTKKPKQNKIQHINRKGSSLSWYLPHLHEGSLQTQLRQQVMHCGQAGDERDGDVMRWGWWDGVMSWGWCDGWLHSYTRFDGLKLRKRPGASRCAVSLIHHPSPRGQQQLQLWAFTWKEMHADVTDKVFSALSFTVLIFNMDRVKVEMSKAF